MSTPHLLSVRGLSKSYQPGKWPFGRRNAVDALIGASFDVPAGSTVALVGRSGSGKSTLVRCLARLEQADCGEVLLDGCDLMKLSQRDLKLRRRELQIVFQHSATAINPRFSALEAVSEPLHIQEIGDRRERRATALAWIETVGIPAAWADRSSLEFSGGERQRLALARALVLGPKLLILDEALAGLDRGTQDRIVCLLLEMQERHSLTYLFITHDLLLASKLASKAIVMDRGRIVEVASFGSIPGEFRSSAALALVRAIPPSQHTASSVLF